MYKEWRRPDKGFFEEFEREFEEMNRLIGSMMHSVGKEPQVYGFSIQIGPDGVPHMERFGNVLPAGKDENVREPFTSSISDEKNNEFKITSEMPGMQKEDIEVNATEDEVTIKAQGRGRRYYKTIRTPPTAPDSSKAQYNNGILEVTLKFKDPVKTKGKTVKVE
ncbi:MAG: Hsp20/alpha crystallin family protein [Candidatus Methanoperedens sp.]|nr:Hsp20/alpha crystallin family protein [Candidatus Methanoperedens sp.]